MKLIYMDENNKKLFDIRIEKLEYIDQKEIITDISELDDDYIKVLSRLKEEVWLYKPTKNREDFYIEYYNNLYYFNEDDYNFKVGTLLSKTLGRYDKDENLLKLMKKIYQTGQEQKGLIKILRNDGKLYKYINYHYFKLHERIIVIHEDKTEIKMYRDSTLNDKDLGVAIYQKNKFVEVNENYAKIVNKTRDQLLGASQDLQGVPENMVKIIKRELKAIENQEKLSYKMPMISYDKNGGVRYYINAEGSYITYNNMPAVLFKIKDLTEQERAKRQNETNMDEIIRLKSTIHELKKYSKTFLSYAIYPDNYSVSENFYDIIEDTEREYKFKKDSIRDFILGEDLKLYDTMINSISPSNPEVEFTTSIMTLKFNIKYIRHYFKRIYDTEGKATSYVSAHQDITNEATYSNNLKKQIYEQNETIKDKDIQIKDAHHTIKNNLNILLSLIRMQEHYQPDKEKILEDTKTHIKSISVMHEKLYQSKTFEDLQMKEYIDSIVTSLFDIYSSKIKYISKVDEIYLNSSQAGTLGLIINELLNNTVKYAFPDENIGEVEIKLSRIDKMIEVEYHDNGIGIPDSVDFENPKTLGLIVVQNLTKQLDGKITYTYDNGTLIKLEFKEKESF
ncbi:MAG: PAS domain S-box protein [Methanosphaera sp.]|nr:PAS domain S-box protein [Methanosphaera sp.]